MAEKNGVGQPSKYKKKYCDELIAHMSEGYSIESFAGKIGVCRDTLYNWVKKHPEFKEAKKIGTEASRLFWEKIGIKHILNKSWSTETKDSRESGSVSLNSAVWVFNMKNRFNWRDKQPDEDSVNINLTLADRIAKARSRANKDKK